MYTVNVTNRGGTHAIVKHVRLIGAMQHARDISRCKPIPGSLWDCVSVTDNDGTVIWQFHNHDADTRVTPFIDMRIAQ